MCSWVKKGFRGGDGFGLPRDDGEEFLQKIRKIIACFQNFLKSFSFCCNFSVRLEEETHTLTRTDSVQKVCGRVWQGFDNLKS